MICLNLVRILFIFFHSHVCVICRKKSREFFGVGCTLLKAFGTGSQWVNASQIAFNIIIFSPSHTPCKIVESRRDLGLYLVDGKYSFLDLILFFVNHFRFLNHATPSSLMAGTLMNHACNRILTEKGKNLTLHNFYCYI